MLKRPVALLLLALAPLAARASDTVYVEMASGNGVAESDLATATELVKTAVSEVSSDTVIDQPDKADLTLRPKLLRLGASYILSLTKLKGADVVFSSQLKAASIDELDKVATRLTRSVLLGERAKDAPRVGEITNQEASDGTQRRPTRKLSYLGFGGSSFSNLNSSGVGFSFGGAVAWDVNTVLLKLESELDINGAAYFLSGGIGGELFLSPTDIAPYVAADFGVGAAKVDGGGVFDGSVNGGFVVGAGGGIVFLRTTAVNLDLGFRAAWLLHSNGFGTPLAYSLRLGLYF
jgi:hypothetical protein